MTWLIEALDRAYRGTMYADAYDEAVQSFRMVRMWRRFAPGPDDRITVRCPTVDGAAPNSTKVRTP